MHEVDRQNGMIASGCVPMDNFSPSTEAIDAADDARLTISLILWDSAGNAQPIEGFAGERLLDALMRARADVMPVCNGRACCGGCRVRIDKGWRARVTPSGRGERSVLRYIDNPHEDDRLSCQIALTAAIGGLEIRTLERPQRPKSEPD
ncbi:2Fe-2S iron-sulfur cluster-binding protein [Methylocella tundrae]|nr:2Fe-2S iron-sulfur cluster-binding protein [Methylocella tundrae]WPP04279.1 2Fe-2S iron-sulfur cluster-binding protein [Methylocella tundrae]